MTKKKKTDHEGIEQKNDSEIIDNKDTTLQGKSKSEVNKNAQKKESPDKVVVEQSPETESASAAVTDKEARPEVSVEEKLAEMQDRYLRISAEFDNYRKRTLREKIELTKHAGEGILLSIIPVMDDFERALKLMESATDCIAMKNGIDLIYNKFRDFLKQHGIREIESMNNDFNVDLHEAVNKVPVEDESLKGKVVDVMQKGYYLHDKVMRFSKVVVGE